MDESQFFFHWDYLNEALRKTFPSRADRVGFYRIGEETAFPSLPAAAVYLFQERGRVFSAQTLCRANWRCRKLKGRYAR